MFGLQLHAEALEAQLKDDKKTIENLKLENQKALDDGYNEGYKDGYEASQQAKDICSKITTKLDKVKEDKKTQLINLAHRLQDDHLEPDGISDSLLSELLYKISYDDLYEILKDYDSQYDLFKHL